MSILSKFKKLPKIIKIILIILIIVSGYFIYKNRTSSRNQTPQYQYGRAEKGTLVVSLSSSGTVAATGSRTVTTSASGVVKRVFVKEGQKVSTGTPILEIDLDLSSRQKLQSAYSAYLSAQNSLKTVQDKILSLESDLAMAKDVYETDWKDKEDKEDPAYIQKHNAYLSTQAAYDNHQAQIKQAQSALESARLSLQLSGATVYSPISGAITGISVVPGMILNSSADSTDSSSNSENKIAIIKTNATPSVSVSLTEIDVPKVKVGNKVSIVLDAYSDKTYTGKVIAVDTSGSVSSGVVSYPATIQFDLGSDDILPNMSATLNIITQIKDDVLKVATSAIQTQNGQSSVRIMKDGQVEFVPVNIGLQSDTETEIISGLDQDQEIIISVTTPGNQSNSFSSPSVFGSFGGGQGRMMVR